jgi:hypothetical protein
MAVTTTVQDVLNQAYAKSLKNQPGLIANEPVELLGQVNRIMRSIYSMAASINPTFFGKTAQMSEASGTWVEPDDSESVYYLTQDSDDAEVIVVPIDEQDAEPGELAVYSLGRVFQASSSNPPAATLNVWYSKKADVETALADQLDQSWDEAYNELLVLEVAIFLAIKDGRQEEVPGLIQQRNLELRRFQLRLEHHLANIRSRWGPARAISTHQTFTPTELLLGEAG